MTPAPILLPAPTPAPDPSGPSAGFVSPPSAPAQWVLHAAGWAADRPWLLGVAAGLLVAFVAVRNLVDLADGGEDEL